MSAIQNFDDSQGIIAIDQSDAASLFDPTPHFGEWLQALETFRNREQRKLCPGVFPRDVEYDFPRDLSLEGQLPDEICSEGKLVVTEHEELQADVEVSVALIDGLFKGKITATRHVVLENHALVVGEINTPALTIRGGAIIEGRCYFEQPEQNRQPLERWERPGWQAFKIGFAKVWRRRIFQ